MAMEVKERVVLSVRDKVLTLICSFGLLLVLAGIFSLCLIPFTNVNIWPIFLKFVFVGVVLVWLSVILDKAGQN